LFLLLLDGSILLLLDPPERRLVVGSSEAGVAWAWCEAEEEVGTPLLRRSKAAVVVGESAPPEIMDEAGEDLGDWLVRRLPVLLMTLIAW